MAEVDGKVVMKAPDGRLYRIAPEEAESAAGNLGWKPASDEETAKRVAEREKYAKFGSTGQQALGAVEQTIRTGTFGLLSGSGTDEEISGRESVLREHSPVVSFGAQALGAALPGIATGGVASGLAGAAGLGARGIGIASTLGEGLAGGLADEIEQARYEARDVSAGNVMLFGLGGEIVGRALPKGLAMGAGKVKRALTAVDEVAGEGVPSALAATEARSVATQAKQARDLPKGPERAEALRRTAKEQYDAMGPELAEDLDYVVAKAGEMGDTSSSKRVTERLRETIADESPAQVEFFTASKDTMARAKEALRTPIDTGAPLEKGAVAETLASGDRAKFAKRYDRIVGESLSKLDKTTDNVEQFLIVRDTNKRLQQLSKDIGLVKNPADRELQNQMREVVDTTRQKLGGGIRDKSLFGAAAEIEADTTASFYDKVLSNLDSTEKDLFRSVGVDSKTGKITHEADPSKARSFLKQDAVDRTLTQRKLEQVLEGVEDLTQSHTRHGTWDPDDVAKVRERVGRIREKLGLADEIQAAKHAEDPAIGPKNPKQKGGGLGEEAAEYVLESIVGSAIPFAGQLLRLGKRLAGIDKAGRTATKAAARNLAGVGLGYAERAMGKVSNATVPAAITALSRFTGDHSGPEESFEAKRRILEDDKIAPEVLYEVLGQTMGDMPKVAPELFQELSARTAQKVRYLRENMPAGLNVSLLYPNGTPPSQSALRDFATMWNTAMDPESVLDDINNGTATPLQMQTLKNTDPDLYEQLRADVIEQVGANFRDVPTSTKVQLDLLFDADGLAGPMFSTDAARYIGEALQAQAEQKVPPPMPASKDSGTGSKGPSGLEAIKTSVTNRGTGS